jgi:rhodanese-related sulfurtransferase
MTYERGKNMRKQTYAIFTIIMLSTLFILSEGGLAQQSDEIEVISVSDANQLINQNKENQEFVILDVRTDGEFKSGHIADSMNIDYKSPDFKDKVGKLDKDKTYLTYCRSGRRSTGASNTMKELGFENIIMIEGGMIAWEDADLPTSKDN